ncbi:hypothetical protein C8J57DRAFT_1599813 [Mycena rebaudengoi]|nr:hypothetical protein C8J57DRAFT_1599813 [Mycena rebaudengoi]
MSVDTSVGDARLRGSAMCKIYTRKIIEEEARRRPRSSTHPRPRLHPAQTDKENDEALEAPAGALLEPYSPEDVLRPEIREECVDAAFADGTDMNAPIALGEMELEVVTLSSIYLFAPGSALAASPGSPRPWTVVAPGGLPGETLRRPAAVAGGSISAAHGCGRGRRRRRPTNPADSAAVTSNLAVDTDPELAGPVALTSLRDTAREQVCSARLSILSISNRTGFSFFGMEPHGFPDSSCAGRSVAFGMGGFYFIFWAARDDIDFPSNSAQSF